MENQLWDLLVSKREKEELAVLRDYNKKTEKFGLTLTEEDAGKLIVSRNNSLKKYQRVEFGKGILDKIIYTFCDSQYIHQGNYLKTLQELQDIFYQFKNESQDKVADDELQAFMKQQFETVCSGDTEYLAGTCLERFSRAVREGYTGFTGSGGIDEYEQFSEEERWDSEVYQSVLKELFW